MVGADRYRNPDEDLPKDFAEPRETYYAGLKLTRDAEAFVDEVKTSLEDELRQLNASLPYNDKVRLRWSGKNRISVSPFEPAPESKGLTSLKSEVNRRWPMTGLLRVRRNYIHPAALRPACARVADATLAIRNPAIWGESGTACAADSTKFRAWDRNLMSEWHARYGGRGVMIYWHVER